MNASEAKALSYSIIEFDHYKTIIEYILKRIKVQAQVGLRNTVMSRRYFESQISDSVKENRTFEAIVEELQQLGYIVDYNPQNKKLKIKW